MKTLKEYQEDIKEADEVRRINFMPEFGCIQRMIKRMRQAEIEKIIAAENPEARHRAQCLLDVFDEIDHTIQRGDVASEAIKDGRYSDSPQGE